MKLTIEQQQEVIEILKFHSTLLGVDKAKCLSLIDAMNGKQSINDPTYEIENIIRMTSEATGVSIVDMMSKVRNRPIVMARSFAMYQIYERIYMKCPSMTWKSIASVFDMDHSSVIQAHQRIGRWLKSGDRLTLLINDRWNDVLSESKELEAA